MKIAPGESVAVGRRLNSTLLELGCVMLVVLNRVQVFADIADVLTVASVEPATSRRSSVQKFVPLFVVLTNTET